MRFAISTAAVVSHLNAMILLGHRLRELGHDVIFVGHLDAEEAVNLAGFDLVALAPDEYPLGAYKRGARLTSILAGESALHATVGAITASCNASLEDGARALLAARADALVLDTVMEGLNLAALRIGMPYVQALAALHVDLTGWTPPCICGLPYDSSPSGHKRNLQVASMLMRLLKPLMATEMLYARRNGLSIDWRESYPTSSKLLCVSQIPAAFDFPTSHWPAHFCHTGPWIDVHRYEESDFPWSRLTGDPLIYASMGTLYNGSLEIANIVIEAASGEGRQLVFSIGENLNLDDIDKIPPGAILLKRVPQVAVLRRAAVCITHGGLNTVLEALCIGVPVICIPHANDQFGTAARVAYTGTGSVLPREGLNSKALAAEIDRALCDSTFSDNAKRFSRVASPHDGSMEAALLIAQALG